jgi:integrase
MTLQDAFDSWLASHKSLQLVTPRTAATYFHWWKAVPAKFQKMDLSEITVTKAEELFAAILTGKTRGGEQRGFQIAPAVRSLARQAYNHARRTDPRLSPENPFNSARMSRGKNGVPRKPALTKAQVQQLIHRTKSDPFAGPLIRFAAGTGARRGEILGLKWDAVDFDAGAVHIRLNRVRKPAGGGGYDTTLKTERSNRVIALPHGLLTELRQRHREFGDACEYVFFQRKGETITPCDPNDLTIYMNTVFQACGLAGYTFHDLRHAHASQLLSARHSLRAVSERLGHANVNITLSTYAHIMPGDDAGLASEIEKAYAL